MSQGDKKKEPNPSMLLGSLEFGPEATVEKKSSSWRSFLYKTSLSSACFKTDDRSRLIETNIDKEVACMLKSGGSQVITLFLGGLVVFFFFKPQAKGSCKQLQSN